MVRAVALALWVPIMSVCCSHEAEILDTSELVVVSSERLVHIVGVGGVASETLLRSACFALVDHLLADPDVFFHLLDEEDVIDFDVMRRKAAVEEARWEHHTIARVPELRLILLVKVHNLTAAGEAESAEDHVCCDKPYE